MSARILTGVSTLINPGNVRHSPSLDLVALEKRMIDGNISVPAEVAPEDKFKEELREVARRTGISFDDIPAVMNAPAHATYANMLNTPANEPSSPYERSYQSSMDARPPTPPNDPRPSTPYSEPNNYGVESLRDRTDEQERREHITEVVGSNQGFSLDNLRDEDLKCAHLAEIDSLMSALQQEDIDVSRLPKVDANSSFQDVETALKIWRHKNDQTRCTSFAEEALILVSHVLEDVFNGKSTYFGRFRPNLKGYHNHMHAKLRRIRHDTGQVVSNMISSGGIGPGWRILMELVPNMFIYSKQRKLHDDETDFADDESAMDGVRAL